jgi:hypothetical protein
MNLLIRKDSMTSICTPRALAPLIAVAVMVACSGTTAVSSLPPNPSPGSVIDSVLAPQTTTAFQSEVLVLGTAHLSGYRDRLLPGHLEPLLDRLEVFAPTRIAVEALTADEVALLAEREAHDPAAAELLSMFGRETLTAGRKMQQAMDIDRVAAERRASTRLAANGALSNDERLDLVGDLLAAYDPVSATLQWSYLPPESRLRAGSLPTEIRELLDRNLQSANEIYSLALPLARRSGLQQIHSMDSQYDGVRILSAPRELLVELLSDPARSQMRDQEQDRHADSVREAAFAAGDLLPLYLHINSDGHQMVDVTQWNWLFHGRHASGLDRFRYALWELRNLRQANHVIDIAASGEPERLLVIVGSSHKAYLDRVLATQLSVRLKQLHELQPATEVGGASGAR